jgi:hypothetical protein
MELQPIDELIAEDIQAISSYYKGPIDRADKKTSRAVSSKKKLVKEYPRTPLAPKVRIPPGARRASMFPSR